jgi:hypothetical protein
VERRWEIHELVSGSRVGVASGQVQPASVSINHKLIRAVLREETLVNEIEKSVAGLRRQLDRTSPTLDQLAEVRRQTGHDPYAMATSVVEAHEPLLIPVYLGWLQWLGTERIVVIEGTYGAESQSLSLVLTNHIHHVRESLSAQ